jgi:ribonuclease VapC
MSSATPSSRRSAADPRIVVDSSALLAILFREPERDLFIRTLLHFKPVISIVTLTEVCAVTHGRIGAAALEQIERQMVDYEFEVASVGASDFGYLRQALVDFGKGRRRAPAALNFGDLFAYALAKRLGLPLLFKGDDFARTDVQAVPRASAP